MILWLSEFVTMIELPRPVKLHLDGIAFANPSGCSINGKSGFCTCLLFAVQKWLHAGIKDNLLIRIEQAAQLTVMADHLF